MSKEQAKAAIEKLVERYGEHKEEYHLQEYNEQKTRQDFINPFFKALGWDVDNEKGDSEAYREVIYEDKVVVRGKVKAPDYGFRLMGSGKKRLFYVEAKKPAVAIKANKEAAYQLRRYGSSAQALVSILTNFEDFIIYDCSRVPNLNDSASVARLKHITFEDYIKEFDFLYDTFSHEAVTKGRFDKFMQSGATKRGTDSLDKRFVQSLDEWRNYLAKSIAYNNRKINDEELNFAVQQTIDRLIFLRFCEDRAVEPYGQLQKAVSTGNAYKNLFELFERADDKYNSGLFDFEKDSITPQLKVDNKVLKIVIDELYYPKCNYEFSVMPVEILGNAYEQFLGKVIRITPARGVKIEEKPEVRKAGGVYYTPQYIVEYIVKNTVGKLIEGKSPKAIAQLKIVDPACGSGSFLLGAYECLLNYHVNWYHTKNFSTIKEKDNRVTPQGTLTSNEKKRILLNNIFGVDIDANATEVTKLSLLLKCMEGETEASIKQQISLFHERVLPDLDNNIKCGNSLIDTDIYDSEIDLGYEKKIKPFNWKNGFPEVFKLREQDRKEDLKKQLQLVKQQSEDTSTKAKILIEKYKGKVEEASSEYGVKGGFDVVIGNPPYGAEFSEQEKKYLLRTFSCQNYQLDSYLIFLEQSIKKLLRTGGMLGMIIPNPWLTNLLQKKLRKYFFGNTTIEEIVHFKQRVFSRVTVDTEILLIRNLAPQKNNIKVTVVEKDKNLLIDKHTEYIHKQKEWIKLDGEIINIFLSEEDRKLFKKIQINTSPLEKYFSINVGIKPYQVGKGKPSQTKNTIENRIFDSDKQIDKFYRKYLRGSDIQRYSCNPSKERYLKYGEWLAEPRYSANFDAPEKIFIRQTGDSLIATLDEKRCLCLNNLHVLVPINDFENGCLYFLGIINSKILNWYYQTLNPEKGEALAEVKKSNVAKLPVKLDNTNQVNKIQFNEIVKHVDSLLKLNEEIKEVTLPNQIAQIKQRIAHSEDKINELVYELYELTTEEIKIVEGA